MISTHPKDVERDTNNPIREVREILVGIIYIPIDRGPPCFNAISERSRTMPFPHTRGNIDASIIPTHDIQVVPSYIN